MTVRQFIESGMIGLLVTALGTSGQASPPQTRARLIIMADMGNEPDEEQQMAHMLVCSNMFDVEGLVAVTGKYLRLESANPYRKAPHPDLFIKLIDAYAQVADNLRKHASGWPDPDHLWSIVTVGQRGYGMADVSVGNSSPGSMLLVEAMMAALTDLCPSGL